MDVKPVAGNICKGPDNEERESYYGRVRSLYWFDNFDKDDITCQTLDKSRRYSGTSQTDHSMKQLKPRKCLGPVCIKDG